MEKKTQIAEKHLDMNLVEEWIQNFRDLIKIEEETQEETKIELDYIEYLKKHIRIAEGARDQTLAGVGKEIDENSKCDVILLTQKELKQKLGIK